MSDNDTYEGWANRETWAFWLHVTNDEGWYNMVRDFVEEASPALAAEYAELGAEITDYALGERVVDYVEGVIEETLETNPEVYAQLGGMLSDIGSWWRIDREAIGYAAREFAEES